MRSDLRALRERIRQVEAGGHRNTPLRREYNHTLRAHRSLAGGGGMINIHELRSQFALIQKDIQNLNSRVEQLTSRVDNLEQLTSGEETKREEAKTKPGIISRIKNSLTSV